MRYQGFNAVNEPLSSMYVERTLPEYTNVDGEVIPALPMSFDLICDPEEGRTRQEFADECDVNQVMARFEKTGQLPNFGGQAPQYLDVSEVPDLITALNVVEAAKAAFMTLPARTRAEFDNDPVKFVAFAEDPGNLDRMREWGLAPPEKAPEPPMRVEVVNAAADQGGAAGGS